MTYLVLNLVIGRKERKGESANLSAVGGLDCEWHCALRCTEFEVDLVGVRKREGDVTSLISGLIYGRSRKSHAST